MKESSEDKPVIAIYPYNVRSWSGSYCRDVIQLIRKSEVLQHDSFDQLPPNGGNFDIEVFVEKNKLKEWQGKNFSVDVNFFQRFGEKIAMLYINETNN